MERNDKKHSELLGNESARSSVYKTDPMPMTHQSTYENTDTNIAAPSWIGEDEEDEEEEDADWNQVSLAYAGNGVEQTDEEKKIESEYAMRYKRYISAVEKDPWNSDAWISFLNELQAIPIEHAQTYYQQFFHYYPTAGHWWRIYAEHALREKQYARVQEIIQKSLMQIRCTQIELWIFYLNFTKTIEYDIAASTHKQALESAAHESPSNVEPKETSMPLEKARQIMLEAFELAIERVGGTIYAAPIWQAYLAFLTEDLMQDSQSFIVLRKLYHRVLTIPMHHMDTLWKEYEKFERAIPNNEALAQSFFKVFRPKFDAAKAVFRERKVLYDAVNVNALAIPGSCKAKDGATAHNAAASGTMLSWKKIVAFEMQNPERLVPLRLKSQIRCTFELFVGVKRHYIEAWYQYAAYENEMGDHEAASAIFQRAIEAVPDSAYIQFACADHYELRGKLSSARLIYETLLQNQPSALVYVVYQRFARRALGPKGLQEARVIFKRARKDDRRGACTFHVYVASALLEYYSDSLEDGKEVALRIFELGLKRYIQEPLYILCYLDFLGYLKEDNNMRSLFEKALAVLPVDKSKIIWDQYVQFEHSMTRNGGDLGTLAKVEARRALALSDRRLLDTKGLLSVMHRYSLSNLTSSSANDQCFLNMYHIKPRSFSDWNSGNSLQGMDTNLNGGESTMASQYDAGVDSGIVKFSEGSDNDRNPNAGPSLPSFLQEFANMLPLHLPWHGPIADVEHIYRAMLLVDFPTRSQVEANCRQRDQQKASAMQTKSHNAGKSSNAHAKDAMENEKENSDMMRKRPAHDIFRVRQKQKLAKHA